MSTILDKLSGLYFFQMSTGSYSDYSVGCVYACDHEVTDEMWAKHYGDYQQAIEDKREEVCVETTILGKMPSRTTLSQWAEVEQWRSVQPRPEDTFVDLHNAVPVCTLEFWRD